MNPNTGMPLNIVNQPPIGAKSGSPMDVANANIAANNAKMSSLIGVTSGGSSVSRGVGKSKSRRHHSLYGGAALVVQPLHVPYPGGSQLQNINTQMTAVGAQNVANSQYDNDWRTPAPATQQGGRRTKRNKRTKRTKRSRRTKRTKRSGRRYKK